MSSTYTPSPWESLSEADLFALSSDPSTPPEVLRELVEWSYFDRCLDWRPIALNPSTPMDLLLDMTRTHAAEVTQNPAFRLQMSMQPDFLQSLSRRVQENIGKTSGVEERLLRHLGESRRRHPQIRAAVAGNTDCPEDLMEAFVGHAWPVRNALAANSSLPTHLLPGLAADKKAEVRSTVGRRKRLPTAIRKILAADEDPSVRTTMARRRDATPHYLARMAGCEWVPSVLCVLIRNPRTPIKAVARLTGHRSREVRAVIEGWRPEALRLPEANYDPILREEAGDAALSFASLNQRDTPDSRHVPAWVLGAIIDYGWTRRTEERLNLEPYGFLNRTRLLWWPPVQELLSEEELFALMRGVTYLEADTDREWFGGSVATTIFLAQLMVRLYPHRAAQVRSFVQSHSRNGWMWGLQTPHASLTPEEREEYIRKEMARIDEHRAGTADSLFSAKMGGSTSTTRPGPIQ